MSLAQLGQRFHNDYQHDAIIIENRRQTGLRIVCSARKDNCIREQTVKLGNGSSTCEQQFANKLFANKGWQLGKDRKHDVCPVCAAHKQVNAPKILPVLTKDEVVQNELKLEIAPPPALPVAANDSEARKHRHYTPAEKKFIIDYTRDAMNYDKERGRWSYKTGWSDDKVAYELRSMLPHLSSWTVRQLRHNHIGQTRIRRTQAEIAQANKAPKPPVVKVINNPMPAPPATVPPELLQMLQKMQTMLETQQVELQRQQIILDRLTADRKQQTDLNQRLFARMNELDVEVELLGKDIDAFNEVSDGKD